MSLIDEETASVAGALGAPTRPAAPPSPASIVTRMVFAAPPERVWNGLLFYEQIDERPPWYLRLVLPSPIRTEGVKSRVGDEVKCLYEHGHLTKRITRIDMLHRYEFDVIEQSLEFGGGVVLTGGGYTLRSLGGGGTEVGVITRFAGGMHRGWLGKFVVATACHMFHRHLLAAMRQRVESSAKP